MYFLYYFLYKFIKLTCYFYDKELHFLRNDTSKPVILKHLSILAQVVNFIKHELLILICTSF